MLALLQDIPRIPLGDWAENFVDFLVNNFEWFFDFLQVFLETLVGGFSTLLSILPPLAMIAVLAGLAWLVSNWRVSIITALGLLLIASLGLWGDAMISLALVLSSTVVALAIGIPLGIFGAQSRVAEAIIRPILDFMQTMPSFVYLVPAVLLLGLGDAPALVAVVVFAMPPAVRLTMLGIQQVSKETVEAAHAFGATTWQTLLKVELPLALPTIMAGINQVIMLALSMVVIATLIGAGGLGESVYEGLSRLDIGLAFEGGVGIVVIAIILDRITRNVSRKKKTESQGMKTG